MDTGRPPTMRVRRISITETVPLTNKNKWVINNDLFFYFKNNAMIKLTKNDNIYG